MKDWKKIAEASKFALSGADEERVASALEALEAAFAPLRAGLPAEAEPAIVFRAAENGE